MDCLASVRSESTQHRPRYPPWKRRLWMRISKDAKVKEAFPADFVDRGGLLKENEESFRELLDWLDDISDSCTFDGLSPAWEHQGGGSWELFLHNTGEWVPVMHWGSEKALSIKKHKKYKLPRGGILIQGFVPEVECDYDFCEVEDDDFVSVEKDVALLDSHN